MFSHVQIVVFVPENCQHENFGRFLSGKICIAGETAFDVILLTVICFLGHICKATLPSQSLTRPINSCFSDFSWTNQSRCLIMPKIWNFLASLLSMVSFETENNSSDQKHLIFWEIHNMILKFQMSSIFFFYFTLINKFQELFSTPSYIGEITIGGLEVQKRSKLLFLRYCRGYKFEIRYDILKYKCTLKTCQKKF